MLAQLVDGHWDELHADFRQFYGLDHEELLDNLAFGECARLAAQLPAESRTIRRLHPELNWDVSDYLLALIADQLANIAYGMGGGKGRKPKPIPRPKARKEKKSRLNVDQKRVRALLFAPRGHEEGE